MRAQTPKKIAVMRGNLIHGSGDMDQAVLQHPIEVVAMHDAKSIRPYRPYVSRSFMFSNMRRGA